MNISQNSLRLEHHLELRSFVPEFLNPLLHLGTCRPLEPPLMKIGGGARPFFTILALPSRPHRHPELRVGGSRAPGAVELVEGMKTWLGNEEREDLSTTFSVLF
ncbi:hypothetical protein J2129_000467 [Methanofollis sp. W23]|nr:hypothetical protein [Methanofollis sp. W23]